MKAKATTGFKAFLFWLCQLTWGLPVNVIGFILFIISKLRGRDTVKFCNSYITYVNKKKFGGVSMGMFIFISNKRRSDEVWNHDTQIHEYGHTIQALLLGPLYWIVIGIPSAIWCNFFEGYRKKNNVSYYKLYCEKWANAWGQKWSGQKQIDTK